MGGIIADWTITEKELGGLSQWLSDHDHLKTCWPYDEIDSIVTAVMSDKKIDDKEQKELRQVFSEFVQICDDRTITNPPLSEGQTISGLCAVCPEIKFKNSVFCFTGAFSRYRREELKDLVIKFGGRFSNSLTKSVNYLIIGAEGNPCWAYACYGRKVEAAVALRKEGHKLQLVHENDFHDAVAEYRRV
jgi:NAD-dependent DNA ligase